MDESITSGRTYFADSVGCPPFTHLIMTGACVWACVCARAWPARERLSLSLPPPL